MFDLKTNDSQIPYRLCQSQNSLGEPIEVVDESGIAKVHGAAGRSALVRSADRYGPCTDARTPRTTSFRSVISEPIFSAAPKGAPHPRLIGSGLMVAQRGSLHRRRFDSGMRRVLDGECVNAARSSMSGIRERADNMWRSEPFRFDPKLNPSASVSPCCFPF